MQTIALDRATGWDKFRIHARQLLHAGIAPNDVQFMDTDSACADLFHAADAQANSLAESTSNLPASAPIAKRLTVPKAFIELGEVACRHAAPERFALLYRLLWRLVYEPNLRYDPLDADVMQVRTLTRTVLRAQHHMKGFVRFRTLVDEGGAELRVAWYEPEHYIVQATAPFFARRFAHMRWSILTPKGCAHWLPACDDAPQGRLHFGPPADASQKPPPDSGEALWLAYYASTFNPARLKRKTMQQFMPRKYWHNLPEADLIEPLCQQATQRAGKMVHKP